MKSLNVCLDDAEPDIAIELLAALVENQARAAFDPHLVGVLVVGRQRGKCRAGMNALFNSADIGTNAFCDLALDVPARNIPAVFEKGRPERPHQLIEKIRGKVACVRRGLVAALLHRFQKQVRACRRCGPRLQPQFRMNGNVRKLVGHLPEMRVEPFVSASVFPGRINFLHGIAEYRAEPMLNGNRIAEFAFDGIDARLRNVRPHAQNVRKIRDFHRAHLAFHRRKRANFHPLMSLRH